eukprot:c18541_g1_i4.p1 GENE.c18541_g1_i4~~c18541_g1_i4.p1  ORF type:complete len:217 (+),score=38.47 c18541_g1_i4:253-903(+)
MHQYCFQLCLSISLMVPKNKADSPLHIAAMQGNPELTTLLLKMGARVTGRNQDGSTPLHIAAEYGHKTVVLILLEHGAKPAAQDYSGFRPLHDAAGNDRVEVAETLLEHGARINARDDEGDTALMHAAMFENIDVFNLLLAAGARVTCKNKIKMTVRKIAVSEGCKTVVAAIDAEMKRRLTTFLMGTLRRSRGSFVMQLPADVLGMIASKVTIEMS